jgi:large subunit ribosomal protein L25
MTASNLLEAFPRDAIGKANRKLAGENRIPAVVYGRGREAKAISVDRHEFELLMSHHAAGSTIVEMKIEGESKPINAMIRELQVSPVKGTILHVDFMAVSMDEAIHAVITLRLVNDPVGVRAGGILTTNFHEVNVEAKPGDLVESIDIDVAALEIGDSLHVSDLVAPPGVTILDDLEEVICSVQAPRAEVEEEVEGEVAAEPELIGEKEAGEE